MLWPPHGRFHYFCELQIQQNPGGTSDADLPAHSIEQYSIEVRTKALQTEYLIFRGKTWINGGCQFAAGFEGQLCYVVSPGNVMADDEGSKSMRLNLFQWMTKEIDRWVNLTILLERCGEINDEARLKFPGARLKFPGASKLLPLDKTAKDYSKRNKKRSK